MDSAAVDEILTTTRSVRRRLDFERPVPPAVLEECIAIAAQAPTGRDQQAWRFLVVTDPAKRAAVAELYREALASYATGPDWQPSSAQQALANRLHEVPVHVLVCSEGRVSAGDPNPLQVAFFASVLPAAWSFMLALRARGLGATWTTLLLTREREVAKLLGIPEGVTQTVLLPVGYTKDANLKPADRKGPEEIAYWEGWGQRRSR